jgi:hypothetical protein
VFPKWSANIKSQSATGVAPAPLQAAASGASDTTSTASEEFVVMLLFGKNSFGDKTYCYLKVMEHDLLRLRFAAKEGQPMNPTDFGTILFAGRGEPTDEVKAEMATVCPVVNPRAVPPNYVHKYDPSALNNLEKRAWDDF